MRSLLGTTALGAIVVAAAAVPASAQTTILPVLMRKKNFTLKTNSEVVKINLSADG